MALFDIFRRQSKAQAPSMLLPPVIQRQSSFLTGYGSGRLMNLLSVVMPSSNRDWKYIAGDLMLNSIVALSISWYTRNFSQAKLRVMRPMPDGKAEPVEGHPILDLLANPCPELGVTATAWWDWFITDSLVLANAYIYKHRAAPNQPPMALQWLAADMVRPAGSLTDSLTGYIYTADGWRREMTLEDVIHLRIGRDPSDWRFGRGPLASVLREVCTDNVASSTAYGLAKSPVPSFVVGPKDPTQAYTTTEDDAITTKQRLQENFSGDDSGGVAVMTNAFELQRVGFSPKDMALDDVRRKPEERICAALGLNPLVLHLGSGLERSTYSNLQQATRSAWTDGMVPLYRRIAEVLTQNLLPDYPETQPGDYLEFDTSDIPALVADLTAEAERAERLYKAGIIDRATAKRISGVVTVPEDEGLYFGDVPLMPQTAQPGTAPATSSTLSPTDINKLVGSATALIRAGFAPEAALSSVGLDPIQHLGLLPVTIKEASKSATTYIPNAGMKEAARRALAWKDEGKSGGTRVGLARANQIANGDNLSEDTVLRMYSFFARHEVDKQAEGFNAGEPGFPSAGRVAWDLWGGDAGYSWATAKRKTINAPTKMYLYGDEDYTAEDVLRLHHQVHDDRQFSDWLASKRIEILGVYVKSNSENDVHPAYGYPV